MLISICLSEFWVYINFSNCVQRFSPVEELLGANQNQDVEVFRKILTTLLDNIIVKAPWKLI